MAVRAFSVRKVDTRYFASGLTGEFGAWGHSFNWDVNVVRADNDATQDVLGTYNIAHIQEALGLAVRVLPGRSKLRAA